MLRSRRGYNWNNVLSPDTSGPIIEGLGGKRV